MTERLGVPRGGIVMWKGIHVTCADFKECEDGSVGRGLVGGIYGNEKNTANIESVKKGIYL